MYPSSFRIRTMSALIREYGTNISAFWACAPLRIRARRSAIGSVTVLMLGGRLRGRSAGTIAKRHSHLAQKRLGFFVRPRGGHNSNIKSNVPLDFIELDLRKNGLVGNAQRVVAVAIKTARRNSAEVSNSR